MKREHAEAPFFYSYLSVQEFISLLKQIPQDNNDSYRKITHQ
jgi:hypothetical protein